MIYLRVKPRVNARVGDPLTLSDVADLLADASLGLNAIPVELPRGEGIWPLDALRLVLQIQPYAPQETVNVLGDGTGWLHREPHKRAKGRALVWQTVRTALCCLLLAVASALTIGWFHTDVNMADAQQALFTAVAGQPPRSALWIAIPYALGVLLGASLYYLMVGREEVSPLAVKLREYSETMEKNAGAGST